jgi:hypothetical protein
MGIIKFKMMAKTNTKNGFFIFKFFSFFCWQRKIMLLNKVKKVNWLEKMSVFRLSIPELIQIAENVGSNS